MIKTNSCKSKIKINNLQNKNSNKQLHRIKSISTTNLKAFSVDNTRSTLIILILANPHFLESTQRRQDRSSNPDRVFTLWWCHNLNLDTCRCQRSHLLGQSDINSWEHGGTSRQHSVGVQVTSNIHITLHNRFISQLVNTFTLFTNHVWLKQHLRTSESFSSDSHNLPIWQFIILLDIRRSLRFCQFFLVILCNISQFLLNISNNLSFCRGSKRVTSLSQYFHQIISQITSCQIQSLNSMR